MTGNSVKQKPHFRKISLFFSMRQEIEKLKLDESEERKEIKNLILVNNQLETKNSDLRYQVDVAKTQNVDIGREYDSLKCCKKKLLESLKNLEGINTELNIQITQLNDQLSDSRLKNQNYEIQIQNTSLEKNQNIERVSRSDAFMETLEEGCSNQATSLLNSRNHRSWYDEVADIDSSEKENGQGIDIVHVGDKANVSKSKCLFPGCSGSGHVEFPYKKRHLR